MREEKNLFFFFVDASFLSLLKQEQGNLNKMNFWLEKQEEKTGNYDGSSSYLLASAQLPSLSKSRKKKMRLCLLCTIRRCTVP